MHNHTGPMAPVHHRCRTHVGHPTATPTVELPAIPAEITMFNGVALSATTPAWDTPIGQKIQELTGVKLVVEYLVGTDIMTKANLMTASGTYPDIVAAAETAGTFIAANAFIPLDELIDKYGDNIKKIYRPKELKMSAQQNGKSSTSFPPTAPAMTICIPPPASI